MNTEMGIDTARALDENDFHLLGFSLPFNRDDHRQSSINVVKQFQMVNTTYDHFENENKGMAM